MKNSTTLCKFIFALLFLFIAVFPAYASDEETGGCCGDTNLLLLYRSAYPPELKDALSSLESRYFIGIETVDIDKGGQYAHYRIFSDPVLIFYDMEGREIAIRVGSLSADAIVDIFNKRASPLTEIRQPD